MYADRRQKTVKNQRIFLGKTVKNEHVFYVEINYWYQQCNRSSTMPPKPNILFGII